MPAGYSGTPLAKKLGIKDGHRVLLLEAPNGFLSDLAPLPDDVAIKSRLAGGSGGSRPFDVILFFSRTRAALDKRFAALIAALDPAGGLWIAWPKKTSGVDTDLTFDVVQKTGLASGLVDNKICAVTDVWSGLRFVVRRADRPAAKKAKATTKKRSRPSKKRCVRAISSRGVLRHFRTEIVSLAPAPRGARSRATSHTVQPPRPGVQKLGEHRGSRPTWDGSERVRDRHDPTSRATSAGFLVAER